MYSETVSSLKVFNLDLIPSLNIECLYDFNFIAELVTVTLWPIVLCFVLLTFAPLFTCCIRGGSFGKAANAYLTVGTS